MSNEEHTILEQIGHQLAQSEQRQLESATKQDRAKKFANWQIGLGVAILPVFLTIMVWIVLFTTDHARIKDSVEFLVFDTREAKAQLKLHDAAIAELRTARSLTDRKLDDISDQTKGLDHKFDTLVRTRFNGDHEPANAQPR